MVEVCRRAIGSQANIKKISLGSLLGLLARHHDLGADVHALKQVGDVVVQHADAAVGANLPIDSGRLVPWMAYSPPDRVMAATPIGLLGASHVLVSEAK